jgi:hypothetical protein
MKLRTLWSVARPAAIVVAAIAVLAAVTLVLALIALPATLADRESTLVLGPVNALPLGILAIAAGLLASSVAVFFLRPWGRSVLIALLKAAGFSSALVLVFFAVLLSQPGALRHAQYLAFMAPAAAVYLALTAGFFALARYIRRSQALRHINTPPQSGLAA